MKNRKTNTAVIFYVLLVVLSGCPIIEGSKTTYSVNFDSNSGSTVDSQIIEEGGKIKEPDQPVRTGYYFQGWYSDNTFTTQWNFNKDTVNNTLILYAMWGGDSYIEVTGGTFLMGAQSQNSQNPNFDTVAESDESPVNEVRVGNFFMSKYEVTRQQWKAVMGEANNQTFNEGDNLPMANISWYDAVEYCNKLSPQEDQVYTIIRDSSNNIINVLADFRQNGYRLPTEAEWEYAARGGVHHSGSYQRYSGSDDVEAVGWYLGNSGNTLQGVGQKVPNKLGLYDMSGNVYEWCWDWYSAYTAVQDVDKDKEPIGPANGISRIVRGGDVSKGPIVLRSVNRYANNPDNGYSFVGFRPVRGSKEIEHKVIFDYTTHSSYPGSSKVDLVNAPENVRVIHGDSITDKPIHVAGYKVSWNTMPDSSGVSYILEETPVYEDKTLYAHWSQVATFSVTFKVNSNSSSGESLTEKIVEVNQDETIPDAPDGFIVQGFKLSSWNTKADGSGENFIIDSTPVTNDIELYAIWVDEARFIYIEGGTYWMGAQSSSQGDINYNQVAELDESPVREVSINHFYISNKEVTQAQWKAIMGENNNPSNNQGDELPVENVSWFDAVTFCNALSLAENRAEVYTINKDSGGTITGVTADFSKFGYRLPTEAEWEYAARGGNQSKNNIYSGSNTIEDVGWYSNNSGGKSRIVALKSGNESGIYDMSGNVSEWCWDLYGDYNPDAKNNPTGSQNGTERVLRGGSFSDGSTGLRVTDRVEKSPDSKENTYGFRLVLGNEITHTITYYPNIPEAIKITLSDTSHEVKVKHGYTIDTLPNIEQLFTGRYNLIGWNTAQDGNGTELLSGTMEVKEDIKLYAQWEWLFIEVQGGDFTMGSNNSPSPIGGNTPNVTVSSFYISKLEVTQALWKAVMGKNSNPSSHTGDNFPVENVSWFDAVNFCNKLSQRDGWEPVYSITKNSDGTITDVTADFGKKGFRLPTEAEWEFAARGGNQSTGLVYSGSNTASDVAWYTDNSGSESHEVGTKNANELGIHDMSGNVTEWCWDWYEQYSNDAKTDPTGPNTGTDRIIRSFSYNDSETNLQVHKRFFLPPETVNDQLGFRLVLIKD